MCSRVLPSARALFAFIVIVLLVSATGRAQTPGQAGKAAPGRNAALARTPDGQPDLQGTWVNFDSTPFETAGAETARGAANPGVNPPSHWADHDSPVSSARRSMVIDPPDGKVPVRGWAEARRDYDLARLGDSYVHETPWVRCITRGIPAGMFPAGYNNAYQIIQVPGYVVIRYEMIHETRIIPLDGRSHVGSAIRLWNGDSLGHWEGDTLVVETSNYNDKGSIGTSAATGRMRGIPQSAALHLVERFRRLDANTITYHATIDDPVVYTRPWTVELPLNRDPNYQMFEYACHEGNFSIPNELSAGRARDRTEQAAPKTTP